MGDDPGDHLVSISEAVPAVMEQVHRVGNQACDIAGVATGFSDLDTVLGGVRPGTITLVAGLDSAALSAFTNGLLLQATSPIPSRVLFCTTTTNRWYTSLRLLSALARVPLADTFGHRVGETDRIRLDLAAEVLGTTPLWILDHPMPTVELVDQSLASLRERGRPADIVVLDRPSRMATDGSGPVIGPVLDRLGEIAVSRHVAVVAIEPTSDPPELRPDLRPRLSDLPGAPVWIDHASAIVLVHDDALIDPVSQERGWVELHVVMNRLGQRTLCRLTFDDRVGLLADPIRPTEP